MLNKVSLSDRSLFKHTSLDVGIFWVTLHRTDFILQSYKNNKITLYLYKVSELQKPRGTGLKV